MTKSLEERTARLVKWYYKDIFDPRSDPKYSHASYAGGYYDGFNTSSKRAMFIINDQEAVINDLQAKLKEETQRADLLSLENEKLKAKGEWLQKISQEKVGDWIPLALTALSDKITFRKNPKKSDLKEINKDAMVIIDLLYKDLISVLPPKD